MLSLASCSKPQAPQQPGSQSNTSSNEKPASTQAKSNPAAEIASGLARDYANQGADAQCHP